MDALLGALARLSFLDALWLFPIAVAVHEFEEWNIVRWYERNFVDLPHLTDKGARAWIVFTSILGFAWTIVAVLTGNPTWAAWAILLAFALMLHNALQHVFYLFFFRDYAPGVVTSVLLLIPVISYLSMMAVQKDYMPIWYLILLAVLVIPNLVQTAKAGHTMLPSLRAVHHFGARLAERF